MVRGRSRDSHPRLQEPRPQRLGAQKAPPREQCPKCRARPQPLAVLGDVPALEAQVARLRSTIVRRRKVEGCNNPGDNVSDIIGHYEKILERTEQQLRELRGEGGTAATPPASPTLSRTESGSTTCSSARSCQ